MGGVFDRLDGQIGQQASEQGISPLDLAKLPVGLRAIMRLMLREVELSRKELLMAMQDAPDDVRMSQSELDEALNQLSKDGWIIEMGEEHITYRVNLRRKAGSTLAKSIWSALDDKIETTRIQKTEGETDQDT